MKKAVRITAWILGLVLLLQIAGMVVLQSPTVQTLLGRWVIGKMQDRMDADISFGSAAVRPFDAILLEDVLVKDCAPKVADMDTLLFIRHFSARFSLRDLLLGGESVYLKRATLDGGCFHLVIEPDPRRPEKPTTNLQRIFRMKPPTGDPEYKWGNLLRAHGAEVKNVHFRMENIPGDQRMKERGVEYGPGTIDWNHLDLILEHMRVGHLRVADDLISCTAQEGFIHELRTGLRLDRLSARKVRVGKGNIHLESFHGDLSPGSHLAIPRLDIDGPLDEYEDFVNNITLDIQMAEGTLLDMQTVSHFGPGLDKMRFRGRIQGHLKGTVADFTLGNMEVRGLSEDVRLRLAGRMTGLPEIYDTRVDFLLDELSFSMKDLGRFVRDWAPEVDLSELGRLAPGERFTVMGHVNGRLDELDLSTLIHSRMGRATAGLYIDHAIDPDTDIVIGGNLSTEQLDLGRILGTEALGPVSLTTQLEAAFPSSGPKVQLDTLSVSRLQALGYNYTGLSASGYYRGTDFDLSLWADDPALQLQARGEYHETPGKDGTLDLQLNLPHANLQAMQLDRRGISVVSGFKASAVLQRTDGHTTGSFTTGDFHLTNNAGPHSIAPLTLGVDAREGDHRLELNSPLADASFQGTRSLMDFTGDLTALVLREELSALSAEEVPPFSGASYHLDAKLHNLQELLAFLSPGLYVEKGTHAGLTVSPAGVLKAEVHSGRVALNEKYLRDVKLHLDNDFGALTGSLTGTTLELGGGATLLNNRLTLFADNNMLGLGYVFNNETEADTRAEFYFTGELSRNASGLAVTGRALPSNLYYKGEGWGLGSGEITYSGGAVTIDRLLARHEDQQLLVDGGYSPDRADTLTVTMDRFDVALLNTVTGGSIPTLEGRATGRAVLLSSASGTPGLLAGIVCDSTRVGGHRMGQLHLSSVWDETLNRFNAKLFNRLDGRSSISAEGYLVPASQQVQLDAKLDRFCLGYAAPVLNTVFHEFTGDLSGDITLRGKLPDVQLGSRGLRLDDGLLTLDFTRVPYRAAGDLSLDNKGLHFREVTLTDGEDGHGTVTGGILFRLSDLNNLRMDTHIRMTDMRALDLPRGVNPVAFGKVYASGKVDVTGQLNKITVFVDAASSKEGEFHLPLGSSGGGSSRDLLSFKDPAALLEADPYELMMAARSQTRAQGNDFNFTARIRATPQLQVHLDLNDESSLTASGNGTVLLESSSAQGSFNLGGDYNISSGNFHFSAMNLVNRDFTIQDGSTVRFNGDVWDTDLDVKGRYTTKASLSNLLPSYEESEGGGVNRRTVYCGINITGKLRNPEVHFDIEVPDLNPIVQSQVEAALNSEDKVQKQFVYLLLAGNFLPTEESGVTTNGSEVLFSNVSSIMSGQLNNIFQKLDIPLDLGLNYQTTQAGMDLFDVAVSTQLFNNRVIVNGNVGNRQMAGGTTTNEVAGDVDVEIKLNRSGTLRLSVFSHSADQYTYYLDNSQRNGGGIAYQREFNSFGQFFRELFASKARREAMALEAATRPAENHVLEIDSNGKSSHAVR